jgi:hypothetical protein
MGKWRIYKVSYRRTTEDKEVPWRIVDPYGRTRVKAANFTVVQDWAAYLNSRYGDGVRSTTR